MYLSTSTSTEYLPGMYLSTFQVLYKLYLSTDVLKYKVLLSGSASDPVFSITGTRQAIPTEITLEIDDTFCPHVVWKKSCYTEMDILHVPSVVAH